MVESQENKEQRKHERHCSREGAFVSVRNGSNKIGQILDISLGGLSYRYVDNGIKHGDYKLDIFLVGPDFRAESIPVQTVYDCEIEEDQKSEGLKIRRQGVQFADLSSIHISLLEYFIEYYTEK